MILPLKIEYEMASLRKRYPWMAPPIESEAELFSNRHPLMYIELR